MGKRYGKHKVHLPLADTKKSWEGTLSMVITSSVVGMIAIYFMALSIAIFVACVGAYVELITHKGYDTITVPFANIIVLGIIYLLAL